MSDDDSVIESWSGEQRAVIYSEQQGCAGIIFGIVILILTGLVWYFTHK
jgi:hypothetical protein